MHSRTRSVSGATSRLGRCLKESVLSGKGLISRTAKPGSNRLRKAPQHALATDGETCVARPYHSSGPHGSLKTTHRHPEAHSTALNIGSLNPILRSATQRGHPRHVFQTVREQYELLRKDPDVFRRMSRKLIEREKEIRAQSDPIGQDSLYDYLRSTSVSTSSSMAKPMVWPVCRRIYRDYYVLLKLLCRRRAISAPSLPAPNTLGSNVSPRYLARLLLRDQHFEEVLLAPFPSANDIDILITLAQLRLDILTAAGLPYRDYLSVASDVADPVRLGGLLQAYDPYLNQDGVLSDVGEIALELIQDYIHNSAAKKSKAHSEGVIAQKVFEHFGVVLPTFEQLTRLQQTSGPKSGEKSSAKAIHCSIDPSAIVPHLMLVLQVQIALASKAAGAVTAHIASAGANAPQSLITPSPTASTLDKQSVKISSDPAVQEQLLVAETEERLWGGTLSDVAHPSPLTSEGRRPPGGTEGSVEGRSVIATTAEEKLVAPISDTNADADEIVFQESIERLSDVEAVDSALRAGLAAPIPSLTPLPDEELGPVRPADTGTESQPWSYSVFSQRNKYLETPPVVATFNKQCQSSQTSMIRPDHWCPLTWSLYEVLTKPLELPIVPGSSATRLFTRLGGPKSDGAILETRIVVQPALELARSALHGSVISLWKTLGDLTTLVAPSLLARAHAIHKLRLILGEHALYAYEGLLKSGAEEALRDIKALLEKEEVDEVDIESYLKLATAPADKFYEASQLNEAAYGTVPLQAGVTLGPVHAMQVLLRQSLSYVGEAIQNEGQALAAAQPILSHLMAAHEDALKEELSDHLEAIANRIVRLMHYLKGGYMTPLDSDFPAALRASPWMLVADARRQRMRARQAHLAREARYRRERRKAEGSDAEGLRDNEEEEEEEEMEGFIPDPEMDSDWDPEAKRAHLMALVEAIKPLDEEGSQLQRELMELTSKHDGKSSDVPNAPLSEMDKYLHTAVVQDVAASAPSILQACTLMHLAQRVLNNTYASAYSRQQSARESLYQSITSAFRNCLTTATDKGSLLSVDLQKHLPHDVVSSTIAGLRFPFTQPTLSTDSAQATALPLHPMAGVDIVAPSPPMPLTPSAAAAITVAVESIVSLTAIAPASSVWLHESRSSPFYFHQQQPFTSLAAHSTLFSLYAASGAHVPGEQKSRAYEERNARLVFASPHVAGIDASIPGYDPGTLFGARAGSNPSVNASAVESSETNEEPLSASLEPFSLASAIAVTVCAPELCESTSLGQLSRLCRTALADPAIAVSELGSRLQAFRKYNTIPDQTSYFGTSKHVDLMAAFARYGEPPGLPQALLSVVYHSFGTPLRDAISRAPHFSSVLSQLYRSAIFACALALSSSSSDSAQSVTKTVHTSVSLDDAVPRTEDPLRALVRLAAPLPLAPAVRFDPAPAAAALAGGSPPGETPLGLSGVEARQDAPNSSPAHSTTSLPPSSQQQAMEPSRIFRGRDSLRSAFVSIDATCVSITSHRDALAKLPELAQRSIPLDEATAVLTPSTHKGIYTVPPLAELSASAGGTSSKSHVVQTLEGELFDMNVKTREDILAWFGSVSASSDGVAFRTSPGTVAADRRAMQASKLLGICLGSSAMTPKPLRLMYRAHTLREGTRILWSVIFDSAATPRGVLLTAGAPTLLTPYRSEMDDRVLTIEEINQVVAGERARRLAVGNVLRKNPLAHSVTRTISLFGALTPEMLNDITAESFQQLQTAGITLCTDVRPNQVEDTLRLGLRLVNVLSNGAFACRSLGPKAVRTAVDLWATAAELATSLLWDPRVDSACRAEHRRRVAQWHQTKAVATAAAAAASASLHNQKGPKELSSPQVGNVDGLNQFTARVVERPPLSDEERAAENGYIHSLFENSHFSLFDAMAVPIGDDFAVDPTSRTGITTAAAAVAAAAGARAEDSLHLGPLQELRLRLMFIASSCLHDVAACSTLGVREATAGINLRRLRERLAGMQHSHATEEHSRETEREEAYREKKLKGARDTVEKFDSLSHLAIESSAASVMLRLRALRVFDDDGKLNTDAYVFNPRALSISPTFPSPVAPKDEVDPVESAWGHATSLAGIAHSSTSFSTPSAALLTLGNGLNAFPTPALNANADDTATLDSVDHYLWDVSLRTIRSSVPPRSRAELEKLLKTLVAEARSPSPELSVRTRTIATAVAQQNHRELAKSLSAQIQKSSRNYIQEPAETPIGAVPEFAPEDPEEASVGSTDKQSGIVQSIEGVGASGPSKPTSSPKGRVHIQKQVASAADSTFASREAARQSQRQLAAALEQTAAVDDGHIPIPEVQSVSMAAAAALEKRGLAGAETMDAVAQSHTSLGHGVASLPGGAHSAKSTTGEAAPTDPPDIATVVRAKLVSPQARAVQAKDQSKDQAAQRSSPYQQPLVSSGGEADTSKLDPLADTQGEVRNLHLVTTKRRIAAAKIQGVGESTGRSRSGTPEKLEHMLTTDNEGRILPASEIDVSVIESDPGFTAPTAATHALRMQLKSKSFVAAPDAVQSGLRVHGAEDRTHDPTAQRTGSEFVASDDVRSMVNRLLNSLSLAPPEILLVLAPALRPIYRRLVSGPLRVYSQSLGLGDARYYSATLSLRGEGVFDMNISPAVVSTSLNPFPVPPPFLAETSSHFGVSPQDLVVLDQASGDEAFTSLIGAKLLINSHMTLASASLQTERWDAVRTHLELARTLAEPIAGACRERLLLLTYHLMEVNDANEKEIAKIQAPLTQFHLHNNQSSPSQQAAVTGLENRLRELEAQSRALKPTRNAISRMLLHTQDVHAMLRGIYANLGTLYLQIDSNERAANSVTSAHSHEIVGADAAAHSRILEAAMLTQETQEPGSSSWIAKLIPKSIRDLFSFKSRDEDERNPVLTALKVRPLGIDVPRSDLELSADTPLSMQAAHFLCKALYCTLYGTVPSAPPDTMLQDWYSFLERTGSFTGPLARVAHTDGATEVIRQKPETDLLAAEYWKAREQSMTALDGSREGEVTRAAELLTNPLERVRAGATWVENQLKLLAERAEASETEGTETDHAGSTSVETTLVGRAAGFEFDSYCSEPHLYLPGRVPTSIMRECFPWAQALAQALAAAGDVRAVRLSDDVVRFAWLDFHETLRDRQGEEKEHLAYQKTAKKLEAELPRLQEEAKRALEAIDLAASHQLFSVLSGQDAAGFTTTTNIVATGTRSTSPVGGTSEAVVPSLITSDSVVATNNMSTWSVDLEALLQSEMDSPQPMKRNPKFWELYSQRGDIMVKLGLWDKAEEAYRLALWHASRPGSEMIKPTDFSIADDVGPRLFISGGLNMAKFNGTVLSYWQLLFAQGRKAEAAKIMTLVRPRTTGRHSNGHMSQGGAHQNDVSVDRAPKDA